MPVTCCCILHVPRRWVVCILCSLSLAFMSIRNYSFFMFYNNVEFDTVNARNLYGECPFLFSGTSWEKSELPYFIPEFYWNDEAMRMGVSALFIGRMAMAVPAGMLSDIGYSKYVLCGGMLAMTLGYLEISVLAKLGVTGYVVENLVEGMADAMIFPSIFTLTARWAKPTERNFFTSLVITGYDYGDALGHLLFYLINITFKSWYAGIFITGTIGLVWLVLWFIFILNSPQDSTFTLQSEYSNRSSQRMTCLQRINELQAIPWLKIFTSAPFLCVILAYCSVYLIVYVNFWYPLMNYQKYMLHLPAKFSEMTNIMTVAMVPGSLIGGWLADWVTNKNIISKTLIKKIFACCCIISASVLQVVSVFIGCNIMLFWVLSTTSAYILGAVLPVVSSSTIDLSTRHAGLLMGIIFCSLTVLTVLRAKIDENVIFDHITLGQWRTFFLGYSALALVMLIPFLFFGSADEQNWRNSPTAIPRPEERSDTEGESTAKT